MAFSTILTNTTRTTAAASWKFTVSVGNSYRRYQDTHYIEVRTTQRLKQKIISILRKLPLYGQNVLVQFWAAERNGTTCALTTTGQPFGLYGNNRELHGYHEDSFQHKIYVHEDVDPKRVGAFGLPGRVFITCRPEQTNNMYHHYPNDYRPPRQDAISSRIWGSFAVPVIEDNQRVGVLEFIMDEPKDSYDSDIYLVSKALEIEHLCQNAYLQASNQIEHPQMTYVNGRKRLRNTKSSSCTKYGNLVPLIGRSKGVAAKILGLKAGTFKNVCKSVGIHEWLYIRNTTGRASSLCRTRSIDQTASSETSSFGTPDAPEDDIFSSLLDFTDIGNPDFTEWSKREKEREVADCIQELHALISQGNEAPALMEDTYMD